MIYDDWAAKKSLWEKQMLYLVKTEVESTIPRIPEHLLSYQQMCA